MHYLHLEYTNIYVQIQKTWPSRCRSGLVDRTTHMHYALYPSKPPLGKAILVDIP